MPRVNPTAAALHGRSPTPRIRLFRPWRRHPVTGRAWQAANWHMRYTAAGRTVALSTGTADRSEAEAIAQAREADLRRRGRLDVPKGEAR